jgi:hypothetical protein
MSDSEFTAETVGYMLRDIVMAVIFFIIFAYSLMDLYNIVVNQSAIVTGNLMADTLLGMFGLVFGAVVVMIFYKNYVEAHGG